MAKAKSLGGALQTCRLDAGLMYSEVGEALGLDSGMTITHYEKDRRCPTMPRLAEVLGIYQAEIYLKTKKGKMVKVKL